MEAVALADFAMVMPGFRLGPLNATVAPGERVALVGENGAGKSTTLRCVAGRMDGYQGSVRVLGTEVSGNRVDTRGRVGVLPERLLGLPWMTVEQHLELLAGFYPSWDPGYARKLSHDLDVPLLKPLGHLSKGTRVKLSFVAAEAFRPPVLLLDEPTSGVDPVMRDRLLQRVDQCLPRGGLRTLLFSTHILEDIEPLADRVLLLREGALVGDVTLAELRGEEGGAPVPVVIRNRLARA